MENTKGSRLFVRIPAYVIGLLIMTLGVAISVKSNLGVSPVYCAEPFRQKIYCRFSQGFCSGISQPSAIR